jgi:hypothetical protein
MATDQSQDDVSVSAKRLAFYNIDASVVGEKSRKLLHEYSNIPEDEINAHVEKIVSSEEVPAGHQFADPDLTAESSFCYSLFCLLFDYRTDLMDVYSFLTHVSACSASWI